MTRSKVHLDTDRHEVGSGIVLDPISKVQTSIEGLTTSANVWIAKVPSQFLGLRNVSLPVAEIGLLFRSEMLTQTLFA